MIEPGEDDLDGATKPFLEHLVDLRRALLQSLIAVAAGIIVMVPFCPFAIELLKRPLIRIGRDPAEFLVFLQVASGFTTAMRISFWGGLLLSLPFLGYAVASFVFPGLRRRERDAVLRGLAGSVVLFCVGVAMGYFVTVPAALRIMLRTSAWLGTPCQYVEMSNYVGFVLKLLLAFGLSFQLPVVLLALGSVGLVTSGQLREKRPYVIVGLFVVAMLLTPPDPITQILMALPLTGLYEMCIWILQRRERNVSVER